MIRKFCRDTLYELDSYRGHDKEDIMLHAINDRLSKSFETYQSELNQCLEYLKNRNEINLIRKMSRLK